MANWENNQDGQGSSGGGSWSGGGPSMVNIWNYVTSNNLGGMPLPVVEVAMSPLPGGGWRGTARVPHWWGDHPARYPDGNDGNGSTGSRFFSDGVWTFGITGTVSAGMIGGSTEIGISLDFRNGFQLGGYITMEHAVGADLSGGFILNYHKPVSNINNFGIPYLNGWGESYNGGLWILDGTYGGNATNPGLNPNNYSDIHSIFNTYSVGVSGGNPFGFTRNKGYTWTTPTIGW